MEKHPFVSVVVPVRNGGRTIRGCVERLLAQDYPERKREIIVVDNGSTDDTRARLKVFGSRIKVLECPKGGVYTARNAGVRETTGKIIVFTDADCIPDRNWLRCMVGAFGDSRIKIAGGRIRSSRRDTPFQRYCDEFCDSHHDTVRSTAPHFGCGNMAVRGDVLREHGGFDSSYRAGADVEFCYRVIKDRSEVSYVPDAIVNHVYPSSLWALWKRYVRYGRSHRERNRRSGMRYTTPETSASKILSIRGPRFFFYRIVQDTGYLWGKFSHPIKEDKNHTVDAGSSQEDAKSRNVVNGPS